MGILGGISLNEEKETVSLSEVFNTLIHKWWIIVLSGVICALLAFGATFLFTKQQYKATCKMYIYNTTDKLTQKSIKNEDFNASNNILIVYSEILKMDTTYENILTNAALDKKYSTSQFAKMLSCGSVKDTPIFYVSVTSESKDDAIKLANAAMQTFPGEAKKVVVGSDYEIISYASNATKLNRGYTKHIVLGVVLGVVASCGVLVIIKFTQKLKIKQNEEN